MAQLSYSDITPKQYIELDGEPYEVLTSHVFRKQQRKPVNQTKLKSLKNGRVVERTFHQSETVLEAELEKRNVKFLYTKRLPARGAQAGSEYWFCDPHNPRDRFQLSEETIGDKKQYLKENELVTTLSFGDEIINVSLPIKMDLKVVEAPPSIRGNTAQGGTKQVTLETGAVVNVPLFINEGDIVRINTETGGYTERVEKK